MYEIAKYVVVYFCFFMIIGLIGSGIGSCVTAIIDWCRKKRNAHKNSETAEKSD